MKAGGHSGGAERAAEDGEGARETTTAAESPHGGRPGGADAPPPTPCQAACHGPLTAVPGELADGPWAVIQEAVGAARRVHRGCREEAGLHRSDPPEDGDGPDPRGRILGYLEAVESRVHRPLREELETHRPLSGAVSLLDRALTRTTEAVEALPAVVPATEAAPPGPVAPGGGVGGALGRLATSLGGPLDDRDVAIRWVARRHLALRLARGADRWTGTVAQEWAGWLAELELAWARWAGAVLRTLPPPGGADDARPVWSAVSAAAGAMDEALAALATRPPQEALAEEMAADLAHWRRSLDGDLGLAGTFLLRTRGAPPAMPRPRTDLMAWTRWEDEVLDRFSLHACLLEVVRTLGVLSRRIPARLGADTRSGWKERAEAVAAGLRREADGLREGPGSTDEMEAARASADSLLASLDEVIPEPASFEEAARKSSDAAVAALQSLLRGLPETLSLHPAVDADELTRAPTAPGRGVRLQDAARQAFDALRMERVRTVPAEVVPVAGTVAAALRGVAEVVAFGFEAADREGGEDSSEARRILEAQARELAAEALGRAAEALRAADSPLETALAEVGHALDVELHAGMVGLMERALADRLQGRILDARSRVATTWEGVRERTGSGLARTFRSLRLQSARIRRRGARLARRGRSMVGGTATSDAPGMGTARLLASTEKVLQGLPLVYQRLFSPDPVEDPTLLAGREVALGDAEARWLRWQRADGIPLVVTGRPGVGISSFVRVFTGRVAAQGGRTLHEVLGRRHRDERELATFLARLLGLDAPGSLDELAEAVLGAPPAQMPDLVALEGLEHTYLRVPGGTDLLERLLTLMAETEPRIFWMGALTSLAWQLMETAEPNAVAQVDRLDLQGLDAEALRQAILLRHRRSGVPLRYEEPASGRRLLRRRLSRAREAEARDRLLEKDFFERLHRSARGNLRLATFQWLRAADFEERDGALTVRPRPDLDFTFLEALGPTQNFTLKAFLEHGTLTLEDHDRIFRLPRQESYQIFKSLGDRHIIRPLPRSGGAVSEATESGGYRINPLLVGGVTALLAGRNIVH